MGWLRKNVSVHSAEQKLEPWVHSKWAAVDYWSSWLNTDIQRTWQTEWQVTIKLREYVQCKLNNNYKWMSSRQTNSNTDRQRNTHTDTDTDTETETETDGLWVNITYQEVGRWNVKYFTEISERNRSKCFEPEITAVMCCSYTASITTI